MCRIHLDTEPSSVLLARVQAVQLAVAKLLTEYPTLRYLEMFVQPQFMITLLETIENSLRAAMKLKRRSLTIYMFALNRSQKQDIDWMERRIRIVDVLSQSDIDDWM